MPIVYCHTTGVATLGGVKNSTRDITTTCSIVSSSLALQLVHETCQALNLGPR